MTKVLRDLVILDEDTGARDNCGAIAKKRVIGDITVYLTYDEANLIWWICWKADVFHKVGYIEARREVAWETFFDLDEAELAKLRAS